MILLRPGCCTAIGLNDRQQPLKIINQHLGLLRPLPQQRSCPVAAHPEQHIAGELIGVESMQKIAGGATQLQQSGPVLILEMQVSQQVPAGDQPLQPVLPVAASTLKRLRICQQPLDIVLQGTKAAFRLIGRALTQVGPTQSNQGIGPLMLR